MLDTQRRSAEEIQEAQNAAVFLKIFAVLAVLGVLAAFAVSHVGQMTARARAIARQIEYDNIQVAVVEMLYVSGTSTLVPTGPVKDLGQVVTSDNPPLVLTDYLGSNYKNAKLGCSYNFASDGTVVQVP
jgi:hypothetical protein